MYAKHIRSNSDLGTTHMQIRENPITRATIEVYFFLAKWFLNDGAP